MINSIGNFPRNDLKTNNLNNRRNITFKTSLPKNVLTLDTIQTGSKVIFAWSGGKDSALALFKVIKEKKLDVISLFTMLSDKYKRVSLSGLKEEVMDKQAELIGIPLKKYLVKKDGYEGYYETLQEAITDAKKADINTIVYGDIIPNPNIFDDLNDYINQKVLFFQQQGMNILFPFTKHQKEIQQELIQNNFRPMVVCTSKQEAPDSLLGEILDQKLFDEIPQIFKSDNPYGDFGRTTHTFTLSGPIFKQDINVSKGEVVESQYNKFIDLRINDK